MRPPLPSVARLLLVGVVVAGCGGPNAPFSFSQYSLTVCAKGATTMGIDVSHFNGAVDWVQAKGGGVQFAFMKCTEGTNFVDPQFADNWSGTAQNGIVRGAYHFFHPATDPVAQADFFIQNAGIPNAGDLPLALDLEISDGLSGTEVAQSAQKFLARLVAQTGIQPVVYTSPGFFNMLGTTAGFDTEPLWVANWGVQCPDVPSPPWNDWTFWQKQDNGSVTGVSGNVDVDQFNGSLSDLMAFVQNTKAGDASGMSSDGAAMADLATSDSVDDLQATNNTDGVAPPSSDAASSHMRTDLNAGCSCQAAGRRLPSAGSLCFALLIIGYALARVRVRWRANPVER